MERYVSSQRRRNVFRRTCAARLQGQVRKPAWTQLSSARDRRGTAARCDWPAGGLRASKAGDSGGHGAAGSPVHERSGAFRDRESFGGERGEIFLRGDYETVEGITAGRARDRRGVVG